MLGKIILIFFMSLLFSLAKAQTITTESYFQSLYFIDQLPKDCETRNISLIKKTDFRRGCCSWHQGVCGCSNGEVVCCDGNFSPSCRC